MSDRTSRDELRIIEGLLQALATLVKNLAIYGADHTRTREVSQEYFQLAKSATTLSCVRRSRLIIANRRQRLYHENMPLSQNSAYNLYLERMQRDGYAGFLLSLNLPAKSFDKLLEELSPRKKKDESGPELHVEHFRWLNSAEMEELERFRGCHEVRDHIVLNIPELHVDRRYYERAINELAVFTQQCATADLGQLDGVENSARQLVERMLFRPEELLPLTTIPYSDEFTYYHSVNVCVLTLRAAATVIDDEETLFRICRAALLHDVGKARIPQEILYKNGRLNDKEREEIVRHPTLGAEILQEFPEMDPMAVSAAFGHHIKDNGQGYPKTIPGYKRGAVTSLIEVADIFEALTAMRPYKKPMPAAQAFEVLYSMPDSDSLRPFVDLLYHAVGRQPIGSRVRTADGEVGVVCGHQDNDPEKAIVRLVRPQASGEIDTEAVVVGVSDDLQEVITDDSSTPVTPLDPEVDLAVPVSALDW